MSVTLHKVRRPLMTIRGNFGTKNIEGGVADRTCGQPTAVYHETLHYVTLSVHGQHVQWRQLERQITSITR